jgi:acetyl esterase
LSGLPPLYLSAAGLDPLRDDTLQLAERLAAAGVSFRCDHVPGVVHGCLRMTRELDAARAMIGAGADFIASQLNRLATQ